MATTYTTTVKASGGDYTSLSAWEAGYGSNTGSHNGDLVTDNAIEVAECYAMQDTAAVIVNGWTTGASNYIEIRTAGDGIHNGAYDTSAYRLETPDTAALTVSENYVNIYGLQFTITGVTGSGRVCLTLNQQATGANEINVGYCIFKGHGNASYWEWLIYVNDTDAVMKLYNSVFYNADKVNSSNTYVRTSGANTVYIENVTMYGSFIGIRHLSGTANCKNVLIDNVGTGGAFLQTSGTLLCNYCASSDATADDFGGTGNRVNQTGFSFADPANGDFDLLTGDASAKDFGTDLTAGSIGFTDDLKGESRGATWDIGAHEFIAAAGGTGLLDIERGAMRGASRGIMRGI